mgnify:CR=1 FL=1
MGISQILFSGMNNVKDPADLDAGKGEAVAMVNVEPTGTGFRLRPGSSRVTEGEFHSGWSARGDLAYMVRGQEFLAWDGATMTLLSVVTAGARMSYAHVNNLAVASNGHEYLVLEGVSATAASPAPGPHKVAPPPGTSLSYYNARLYIASGNHLYCTEPFSVDSCDERTMHVAGFSGPVRGIAPVDDGIFVGTQDRIFFLAGADPFAAGGMQQRLVADYGMVMGTIQSVDGGRATVSGMAGSCAIFATSQGVCVGGAGGAFKNLSIGSVSYQYGDTGAAAFVERDGLRHYMVSLPTDYCASNRYTPPTFDIDSAEL